MNTPLLKSTPLWGFALWLIGYVLGILLYAFVPPTMLGWIIMPFGILITLWVLFRKIKSQTFRDYFFVAVIWTFIAVIFDYLFLVLVSKPADGYYKLDVYIYYALTFVLPLAVGWYKTRIPKIVGTSA